MSEIREAGQILSIQGGGEVRVRGADNDFRTLKVGDVLHVGDTLLAPDNVMVQLDAGDGRGLSLHGGEDARLTPGMLEAATATPAEGPSPDPSVAELVESILSGEEFEDQLEATAAGPAGGGAEGEGSSFIRLDRIQEGTEPAQLNRPPPGTAATPGGIEPGDQVAPTALPDAVQVDEDGSTVIDVLTNDSDSNGEPLQVTEWTQPEHGTLAQDPASGLPVYTPDPNYNGPDAFQYTIADPAGNTSTATVAITVNPVNDAPLAQPDTGVGPEDNAVIVPVLENDTDLEGDALFVIQIDGQDVVPGGSVAVEHGSASLNQDGTITFTPDVDYNGPVSFDYTISDGAGGIDNSSVSLTITPVNDAPVAVDDSASTPEDVALVINAAELLSNDSDIDGDSLSITGFTQPAHGTLTDNGDGSFTYTPAPNYNGPDSFSYSVSDGQGGTDSAAVNLVVNPVNDPPVALGDSASTLEDTPVVIGAAELLSNDSDIDGDTLTITGFSQPAHGSIVDNGNGSFTYTPEAGYSGGDSFTYTVSDGQGGADSAVVALSVGSVNDPPVAADDAATTPEDTPVTINVTGNDYDVDGTIVGWALGTMPAHGSLVNNGDGTFGYTPDSDYTGPDSFSYSVTDNQGGSSNLATVNLTVDPANDPAVVFDSSGVVFEDALQPAANVDVPLAPSASATGSGIVTDVDGPLPQLSLVAPANGAFTSGGLPINWSGSGTVGDPLIGTAGASVVATVWITSIALSTQGGGNYEYSYRFDLSGPVDHLPTVQGEESLPMNFTVVANADPLAETGTLSIGIEDDSPVAVGAQPVSLGYSPEQAPASGELGVSYGADGAAAAGGVQLNLSEGYQVVDVNSGAQMTSGGDGLHWYSDGPGGWFAATAQTAGHVIEVTLQPGADQYTVALVGPLDGASTTVSTPLTTAGELHGGNTPQVSFDVDQDNDGQFDAYLNVTGTADGTPSTVNVSANSIGVGRGQSINPGDQLIIEYYDSASGDLIPSYQATVGIYVTGNHSASGSWSALSGGAGGTVVASGDFSASNGDSIGIDPPGSFDTLVFVADDVSNYGVYSIQLHGESVIPGVTQQVDLGFTAMDADGDTALGALSITFADEEVSVLSKLGSADAAAAEAGVDDGLDVLNSAPLVWQPSESGEPGSPNVETIADFTPGHDILSLGDLVQGDSADALASYLHFDVDGADTVVHVSSSGGFSNGFDISVVDQQIVMQDVDLSYAGTLGSDLHIIQDLLDNGSLEVD